MMTPDEIITYCLAKPNAYLDYPFGPDTTIVKVEKRIFAQIFNLKGENKVTLNCTAMTGLYYRNQYPGTVVRGYHCPPIQQPYFNTLPLDDVVPDSMLIEMIDHSYETVVSKLPKYVQKRLADE